MLVTLLVAIGTAVGRPEFTVGVVRSDVLEVHVSEGRVEHHKAGHRRGDERIDIAPLDTEVASRAATWRIGGDKVVRVARKSKGTDFAWFTDRWVTDHAENDRPDHVKEHWIYLFLDKPLANGQTVTVDAPALGFAGAKVTFNATTSRSEAVHVNLLGYVPDAPAKFGYVYGWLGDGGPLSIGGIPTFRLVNAATGRVAFSGKTALRRRADNAETARLEDTPQGNFLCADVLECDFSTFRAPGVYRLVVDHVGCSAPFRVDADVYRPAFVTTTRGLYHNRSGIALERPYTTFERPAPHNPLITPGFRGKLMYTSSRMIDWKNWEYSAEDVPAIKSGFKGPIDVWGWYQDAGDWDGYYTHIQVAQELLLAFQTAPGNFAPRELNIPESANCWPDILNEAAWLPRFCHRLRHELIKKGWGTGGVGLRVCGDHFGSDTGPGDVGRGSWQDVDRTWIVSGEDPLCTYQYAGAAAQLARCLEIAGKTDPRVDWKREAIEAYDWARSHTRPGDDGKISNQRAYAAGSLFALTGNSEYEKRLDADTKSIDDLWDAKLFGPVAYLLSSHRRDTDLDARLRRAVLRTADEAVSSADRRALRWGGAWGMPMLVGQQTTPMIEAVIAAYAITRNERYRSVMFTTADYFLGTNPLNMTWVTGLGPRNPQHIFHMDSWYRPAGTNPGIVPYGPWKKDRTTGQGPWDHDWANKSVYPGIDAWPGAERWFSNQCCPMSSEFTVWQNIAPSAALFGVLCGRTKRS